MKKCDEFKKKCKAVELTRGMARQEASARRARAGAPAPSVADELSERFGDADGPCWRCATLTMEEGTEGAP